jgi:eukaryotic-like serine/threonine-protein kinase
MTAPRQTASSERNASERQSVEETGSPQTLSNQSQEETKSVWPFDPPLVPGELGKFAGYRIIKLLGQGGMGAVFLAEELILQRCVAIKMMKPDVAAKPDARERFLREARSAAGLKSDHIITIFQVGEVRDVPFLAMELLDGLAMDQWLNTQPKQLPIAEVTRIAQDVLSGLAAAQAKGLVHRDIKPANLWIDTITGRVKILDFGLTRPSEGEHITQSGAIVGTPAYMAPEQADGQPVDGRADLFSLGVVLYRMLTGVNPFQRDGMMSTLSALATYHPPAIIKSRPDAPIPLVNLVHRMLAKDANERPANAAQALTELSTINSQLLLKSVAITKPEVSPFADLDDDLPTTTLAPERQPKPTASAGKVKALPWLWVMLGFFGLLCCGAAGVIIIKITNKDGSVTKIEVPEGSKLEVNGKNVTPEIKKAVPQPTTFKNSLGMEFVKVPKGTGWLGGGGGKQGETKVVIEQDFYLGKYEVTQEEWEAVTGQNPSHFSRSGAEKDAVKDIPDADLKRFPVENVSWDDCHLFIERLNKKEKEFGRVYRLPSEEEWEYASRGGALSDRLDSAFDFYFAKPTNQLLPDQANFSPDGDGKVGFKRTCKVGTYQPNQLGLYDMHGNVWEWCSNVYTTEGMTRVCRGGGWNYGAGDCRSANRRSLAPSDRVNALGFRLVLVPVGPAVAVPTAAADADRKAIEWLLNRGADFGYSNATGFHLITKGMKHELPAGEVMLNSFNMSKREFSDQDLERFRGLKNLSTVVLVATEMTNVGCEHLATLPSLQKVYLTDTKISDDGIKHLAQAVKLDVLHISGTKITDIGLQHLAGLKALNELTIVKTGVSEAGVKKFAAALPKCKIESDFGVIEPK